MNLSKDSNKTPEIFLLSTKTSFGHFNFTSMLLEKFNIVLASAIEVIKNVVPSINEFSVKDVSSIAVPCLGKIAAGYPIEAISHNTNYIDFPQSFLGKGEFFLLDIEGDSMVNAGILDGDQVLIEKTNDSNNGEIVVALIDNNEAVSYTHLTLPTKA